MPGGLKLIRLAPPVAVRHLARTHHNTRPPPPPLPPARAAARAAHQNGGHRSEHIPADTSAETDQRVIRELQVQLRAALWHPRAHLRACNTPTSLTLLPTQLKLDASAREIAALKDMGATLATDLMMAQAAIKAAGVEAAALKAAQVAASGEIGSLLQAKATLEAAAVKMAATVAAAEKGTPERGRHRGGRRSTSLGRAPASDRDKIISLEEEIVTVLT